MIKQNLKRGLEWNVRFTFCKVIYNRNFNTKEEAEAFEAGVRDGSIRCTGSRRRPVAPKVRCSICKKLKPLEYDHDHTAEEFRGWLCHTCNLLLGMAYDNPDILEAAAKYLRKHKEAASGHS